MKSHETQLGIKHGSAAGPDSQAGINAPMGVSASDNVLHDDNKFVPLAMAHGTSPSAFAGALDEALTDDSLGLTPPKAPTRGRARSLLRVSATGRPPLTKRSPSLSLKRTAIRAASPAILKRLRNVAAPVTVDSDASVQIRLAALEQQACNDHAYKLELVQAVQNLQAVAATGQQKFSILDGEAEGNHAEHLELRRELFAMRDQREAELRRAADGVPAQDWFCRRHRV